MSLSSSSHSGSRDRTTSSRSFAPPERLSLSVQEAIGVEELALAVVGETLEAYEAHRMVDKRHVLSEKWKEVRRHENIIVYKERQGWRPPFQTLRTMDGRLTPVMCKNAPTLLALGTLQGSLDDEMYGCFIDTDEAATTRSAYLGDGIEQLRWLAEIRGPSKEDPFRFCGVCWCALGSPYPLVKKRDYCIAVASGMTRTQHGERVGYYAIHSVDLWSPRDGEHTFVRSKGSLCWLKTELRTGKVDLFVKGFFAPMGNVPEFAGQASLISAMLATAQTSDASYSKKLEWMIRDAAAASSPNQPLPPMYECVGRCKTAFGIAKSSGFKRCIVCKMPICSTCEIVRKIAVDVSNGHVLKNRCSICLHCMNHAKNANAATYAVRDTQMSNSRRWKSVDAHSTSTLLLSEDTGIQYADDVPTVKPYY